MMKIYELRNKNAAYFETEYCGITVPMEFTLGAGNGGEQRAELMVMDKFTQDAVEADPRFGNEYYLAASYDDKGKKVDVKSNAEEIEEDIPVVDEEELAPKSKPSRKRKARDSGKEFKTLNDAIYYLEEELGVETNDNNIESLMQQHNIIVKA